MKRLVIAGIIAVIFCVLMAMPVLAIDPPDSTPSVEKINAWRNVLETGDFLIVIYENTPYATPPTTNYSEAFIWRLMDTDGSTELAQALGANYHNRGYGYNVIAFYFAAADAPTWEQVYYIRLTGTLAAFDDPPTYSFNMAMSDYSSLTDTDDVKVAIADRILELAADLDNRWGLEVGYTLLSETEAGSVLSIYGESFFRQAIYGVQAMAPAIFQFSVNTIGWEERTWDAAYVTELEEQYSGTYLEEALEAGEGFFDVTYNLMGVLIILIVCVVLIFAHWYLGGGNLWRGMVESVPPLVIGSRLALFGLGELGLIAAICWLYISGKIWKVF